MDMRGPLNYGQPAMQNQQRMAPPTPDYLKQDASNGTAPGVVSNMVKALVDGNNKFKQGGAGAVTPNVGSATSYEAPGAPMSLSPSAATGQPPMSPGMSPSPMGDGSSGVPFASAGMSPLPGMPNGIDPTMSALFSSIPGQ